MAEVIPKIPTKRLKNTVFEATEFYFRNGQRQWKYKDFHKTCLQKVSALRLYSDPKKITTSAWRRHLKSLQKNPTLAKFVVKELKKIDRIYRKHHIRSKVPQNPPPYSNREQKSPQKSSPKILPLAVPSTPPPPALSPVPPALVPPLSSPASSARPPLISEARHPQRVPKHFLPERWVQDGNRWWANSPHHPSSKFFYDLLALQSAVRKGREKVFDTERAVTTQLLTETLTQLAQGQKWLDQAQEALTKTTLKFSEVVTAFQEKSRAINNCMRTFSTWEDGLDGLLGTYESIFCPPLSTDEDETS